MNYDVYLVGVGGQGVLTIGEVLTEAAHALGLPANFYPTKGMAQRGGFVKAQLRLGRAFVGPSIPEKGADLVIALEVSEALRAVRFIKPGGDFVLWAHVWQPTAVMLGKATYPELAAVEAQIAAAGARQITLAPERLPLYEGRPVSPNVFVLAAALGQTRLREVIAPETAQEIVRQRWPKAAARNAAAFQSGLELSL